MMHVITWPSVPYLSVAPGGGVTTANVQAMVASPTSFCFGKHLPPNLMWNGGIRWDAYFLIHTGP